MKSVSTCLLVCTLALAGCHGGGKPEESSNKETKGNSGNAKSSDSKGSGANSKGSGADSKGSGADTSSDRKEGSVPADTIKIKAEDLSNAGIRIAAVVVRRMPQTLTVAGQVAMDEKHTSHIGVYADGRVQSVSVLPGDRVRRGQTLATLHSHSVHETAEMLKQGFDAARRQASAVAYATQVRDRYAKLYSIQAASLEEKQNAEQQLAEAEKNLSDARATVVGEREHLADLLQMRPESITEQNLYTYELIPVRAVSDGVVITRSITAGQVVNSGDEAFVISNLSTVWVNASVNEKDLPSVKLGAAAVITTQGLATSGFPGTVAMLGDTVDTQSRTLPVRVVVSNPQTRLRPGMFATAAISEQNTRVAIFVPADALQDVNGFRVVFVSNDGTSFTARAVTTGAESQGMVEITGGLQPSDHVVVSGAFMVKGELLKGTVGEG